MGIRLNSLIKQLSSPLGRPFHSIAQQLDIVALLPT
jgi:hypothetical protein